MVFGIGLDRRAEVCTSTAGCLQGNPLTNLVPPALINKALKSTEPSPLGVELRHLRTILALLVPFGAKAVAAKAEEEAETARENV